MDKAKSLRFLLPLVAALILLGVAAIRSSAPLPTVQWQRTTIPDAVSAESPPNFHWPEGVESAVAIPTVSSEPLASSPNQTPVPIASLAKLMSAYLVLKHKPLAAGSSGPDLVITNADVETYITDIDEDQSSVEVTAGEKLTEYQLLQALLVRSANNIASLLGAWVDGSDQAFVADMNATARALGMIDTHFADTSGFSPQTVSTAKDVAIIATADMDNPVFAKLVDEHELTLPNVGTLPNIVKRIGTANVVGIKSGFTDAAGGCAAIATIDRYGKRPVTALAVVIGEKGYQSLRRAASQAEELADLAGKGVAVIPAVHKGQVVGYLSASWLKRRIPVVALRNVSLQMWAGTFARPRVNMESDLLKAKIKRGEQLGTIDIKQGTQDIEDPIIATASINPPSLWWRIIND